ncbi:MAG: competence/damage-inducible protein A [Candidatus Marinimicrobia bacterium]|nr:competence/damage-inducible protein A [Candidatus Neomarinimicrobiota bacterium]|tara:strand:- start:8425 stop:9642 length:1218 start_codon:yes stop_codon:yes gene_type:complete
MKSSIITIGNELLGGYTVDSNGAWIGRKLIDIGILPTWRTTVPDEKEEIINAMSLSVDKANIVICTGGLGPTSDDVTLDAYCDFVNTELEIDEQYLEDLKFRFKTRGISMPEVNKNQALVPKKGNVISNPKGSARGVSCIIDDTWFFLLPGVPTEMKTMMEDYILPELKRLVPEELFVSNIRTTGIMESVLHELLGDIIIDSNVSIGFLPGFSGVDIRLTSNDKSAISILAKEIYKVVGKFVYAEDWVTLEQSIGEILQKQGMTLSIAESCTGGLLGDRITNIPSSSNYFKGGVVCYSDESKIKILGVDVETINKFGAVSVETACQMAKGVRKIFNTDLGLSITGIAGPRGGTDTKPIGFTCFALDDGIKPYFNSSTFFNDRRFNKELSAQKALNIIRLRLTGLI